MNVALAKTGTERAPSDIFAIARDRLPGAGKIAEARRQAFDAYERAGLPHRRIEEWKYTDLRVLMREVLPPAPEPDAAALKRASAALKLHAIEGARRLVLVDGAFAPKLSQTARLEKGLGIRTLREVLEAGDSALQAQLFAPDDSDAMVALNSAMMTDGVVVEVADGAALSEPLHIVHISSGAEPAAMFTRSLLKLGNAASATLVESYIAADGAKAYQVHDSLVVSIGDGARLGQRIECEPLPARHHLCGGGLPRRSQRRQSAQWPPACRHHAASGSCGAELRQPRNLPGCDR